MFSQYEHGKNITSESGCSKLTTLLINVPLKFETMLLLFYLIYLCIFLFLFCVVQKLFSFFRKKYQCFWL